MGNLSGVTRQLDGLRRNVASKKDRMETFPDDTDTSDGFFDVTSNEKEELFIMPLDGIPNAGVFALQQARKKSKKLSPTASEKHVNENLHVLPLAKPETRVVMLQLLSTFQPVKSKKEALGVSLPFPWKESFLNLNAEHLLRYSDALEVSRRKYEPSDLQFQNRSVSERTKNRSTDNDDVSTSGPIEARQDGAFWEHFFLHQAETRTESTERITKPKKTISFTLQMFRLPGAPQRDYDAYNYYKAYRGQAKIATTEEV